jgi:hypothetical protein
MPHADHHQNDLGDDDPQQLEEFEVWLSTVEQQPPAYIDPVSIKNFLERRSGTYEGPQAVQDFFADLDGFYHAHKGIEMALVNVSNYESHLKAARARTGVPHEKFDPMADLACRTPATRSIRGAIKITVMRGRGPVFSAEPATIESGL